MTTIIIESAIMAISTLLMLVCTKRLFQRDSSKEEKRKNVYLYTAVVASLFVEMLFKKYTGQSFGSCRLQIMLWGILAVRQGTSYIMVYGKE